MHLQALPTNKPESWNPREELLDLWSVYIGKETDSGKQEELAKVLDISPKEVESLRKIVEAGQFRFAEEAAEEELF